MRRPIILGSSLAKVPYRSSPLGQHLELLFVFLQYTFGLLVCLAVNGLETSPGNKCCSRYFVHAVFTVEQVCNVFPMSSGEGFPGSKSPPN